MAVNAYKVKPGDRVIVSDLGGELSGTVIEVTPPYWLTLDIDDTHPHWMLCPADNCRMADEPAEERES